MGNTISPTSQWALVTGASAGIGAEFARQLAADGYNVVLTARREDRLQQLAGELHDTYQVQTHVIAADLAQPDAITQITTNLRANDIQIHTLINNAGYGTTGHLNQSEWQVHQDFIQVMVTAVVEMSHTLLPDMQAAGAGQIVNVASLAGHVPAPASHTLYSPSKAFLIKFSEALALENEDKGVKVQALCPGFTYSEFHDVIGLREEVSKMPKYMWMSAEAVVSECLKEMAKEKPRSVLINGRVNRFIARLANWLPHKVAVNMVRERGKEFRAEK